MDLLSQFDPLTNISHLQSQLNSETQPAQDFIDSPLDSFLDSPSPIQLNIDLIDQFIDAPVLSLNLKALINSLNQYTDLQFYTDGSLQKDPTFIDSMGLGWICANNEALIFSTSTILWSSSIKAEMMAVLTVLLTVLARAKLTIYTDSAATIDGMAKIHNFSKLSVRKREKIPNFPIWMTIAHVMEVLKLTVKMVKIKAHSGDRLNEKADQLAKATAFSTPRLNLNYTKLLGLNLVLACDHLIVEASSRKCIKQLSDAHIFHQYLQLQRNSNIKTLTELHHIYWSATSFILNYNVTDKDRASTSFTQHRMRIFKYKLFSDKLPTLTHLKQRQPNLYTVDECLFCRRHSETQAYL